ncbi:MAG: hypothetical protein RLZZ214_1445, partial [Verrucomicrobiota bacterium]
ATVGSVYLALTDRGEEISPEDFVSALLIGDGTSLPETAILINDYPAIEYIRLMPINDQVTFVRHEGAFPFEVPSRNGFSTQMRTYKQLNDLDCEQLFVGKSGGPLKEPVHIMRILEKSLAHPDRDYLVKVRIKK